MKRIPEFTRLNIVGAIAETVSGLKTFLDCFSVIRAPPNLITARSTITTTSSGTFEDDVDHRFIGLHSCSVSWPRTRTCPDSKDGFKQESKTHEAQSFSDLVALSSGIISDPFIERDAKVRAVEIPSARNPDPTICPACGERVSSDLGFCPLCGAYKES